MIRFGLSPFKYWVSLGLSPFKYRVSLDLSPFKYIFMLYYFDYYNIPAWVQEQLDSMTDEFLGNMRTAIEHLAPSSVQCVFQIITKLPAATIES